MYIRIYLFIYIFYLSWCMLGGGEFEWKTTYPSSLVALFILV